MLWYSCHTEQEHNCCCSVAQSCLTLRPQGLQHARLPCPPPAPRACPNSCPSSWQWHPMISSFFVPFFFCLQSFPASGSFQMSQFFGSGGQSIGVSASTSVLPMIIQDWFPLGWIGLISLKSRGLSRVFSNTAVQKYQFFGAQLSLWFNSHIHTWLLEKFSYLLKFLSDIVHIIIYIYSVLIDWGTWYKLKRVWRALTSISDNHSFCSGCHYNQTTDCKESLL